MDNLKMHSLDGVQRNIELIGKLFPNAITEVKRNGKVEHAIDFDVLRQELSDSIVEGREERYQFTWPDKKKAMLAANAPITATLRPVVTDSVGKDGTPGGFDSENLYIEGDNLVALIIVVSAGGVPFLTPHSKFIIINKVIPRIIRRIDVNHLDLA